MFEKSPFPWFGGKRKVAPIVWERFGAVVNYVEPFFGSGAVLLGRPSPWHGSETVNDMDGFVVNFWRSVQHAPDETARWADTPVFEVDLHARHAWLVEHRCDLLQRLEGDPLYFDAQIAGWWVWGICCWIGSGWCSGDGPWSVDADGKLTKKEIDHEKGGVWLGDRGQGINRKLPHLGNRGRGINRKRTHLGNRGRGINRKRTHLGNRGRGIMEMFTALFTRFRDVRVCAGDWTRVCGPCVTYKHGITGIFLDPPYSDKAKRSDKLYRVDSLDVSHEVREWAIKEGKNPLLRIAMCGYEGEHEMPPEWTKVAWKAGEGYGGQACVRTKNGTRERIWFSPSCLTGRQLVLW